MVLRAEALTRTNEERCSDDVPRGCVDFGGSFNCGEFAAVRIGVEAGGLGWLAGQLSPIHFLKEAEFSWLMMISSLTGRVSSTLILLFSRGLKRLI
jgi:hypothetical protein